MVEINVVDLCLHTGFTGLLRAGVMAQVYRTPGIGRNGEVVAVKKMLQGLNMALLRIADVLKRAYRPKVLQYLGIGGPGVILVVQSIVQCLDFGVSQ
ncbi:hypothetical protein BM449_01005 [Synechococcus sp. SynAce01]|nr:hypothetical protein BM449_01005 [Synechococcus sp. SynAce01]